MGGVLRIIWLKQKFNYILGSSLRLIEQWQSEGLLTKHHDACKKLSVQDTTLYIKAIYYINWMKVSILSKYGIFIHD